MFFSLEVLFFVLLFISFIMISFFRTQETLELHIVKGDCRHGRAKLYSKSQYFNNNQKERPGDQGIAKVNRKDMDQ